MLRVAASFVYVSMLSGAAKPCIASCNFGYPADYL